MIVIASQEIKRRGISAVDELLVDGPVHVLHRNRPAYVVLSEARYQELIEAEEIATVTRVKESLADLAAGNVQRMSAQEIIDEFELED